MRYTWVLLLCLAVPSHAGAEKPGPGEKVGLAWRTLRPTVFSGEAFELWLELRADGWWLEDHAVPLFAQPVDWPLEVEASGLKSLPGMTVLPRPPHPIAEAMTTLALNGERAQAYTVFLERGSHATPEDKTRRDSTAVLRVETRYLAGEPGQVVVPAPTLRLAYASSFTEDALGTRTPVGRKDHVLRGEPLPLTVLPLPQEGRPAEFGGAIGRFDLWAKTDRSEVQLGQSFRLTLRIMGDGNLELFEPPRLGADSGFHVYGVTDDRGLSTRTLVFDLALQRAHVTAVPAFVLPYFDPRTATYRTATTGPIPLTGVVVGGPPAPPWIPTTRPSAGWNREWIWVGVAALLVVGGLLFLVHRRHRPGARPVLDPAAERLAAAVRDLRAAVSGGGDLSEPFAEVLAARLGQPRAAAIAPDLAARLIAVGTRPEDAQEAARVMECLTAARYGGAPPDPTDRDRIFTLAARLAAPGGAGRAPLT